ncbi:hypothetical protein VNI00_010685 [Paramarasmius palmivorus]|uniref:HSF-type DNA-binding domain-containing protein n=1 Tax=Paramarasmius palmivorus TaxID=297713 RepID=A0AAW0CIP9_9AGAR
MESYDPHSQPQHWYTTSAPGQDSQGQQAQQGGNLSLNLSSLSVNPSGSGGVMSPITAYPTQQGQPGARIHGYHPQNSESNRRVPLRITTSGSSSGTGSGERKRSFTTSNPPSANPSGPSSSIPADSSDDLHNLSSHQLHQIEDIDGPGQPGGGNAGTPMDMDDFSSVPPSSAVSTTAPGGGFGNGGSPVDGTGSDDSSSGGPTIENGGGPSMSGYPGPPPTSSNGVTGGVNGIGPLGTGLGGGMGASMGMLGKPMPTNNFVTKLYQMINDPKSAHFISWTELGTSFVVSNVGEFSRSILGSHFKHNNFSSFVRQLNMYGFHKINRTPRTQRLSSSSSSSDGQTWEFSHHKFLRGRPDLLDEIKRKALEPDPGGVKARVELPGEVAAQLTSMRDENRRMWDQLNAERRKVDKLVGVVNRLWDYVGKIGGGVPPFPIAELLDSSPVTVPSSHPTLSSSTPGTATPSLSASTSTSSNPDTPATEPGAENPNIFVTSPPNNAGANARFNMMHSHSMHPISGSGSVGSSPTTMDFPPHIHGHGHNHYGVPQFGHAHGLSRQHSFPSHFNPANTSASRAGSPGAGPNVNADNGSSNGPDATMGDTTSMFDDASTNTTTSSEGRGSVKRQRMSDDDLLTMNSMNHNGSGDVYGGHFSHHAPTHPHTPTHNHHHLPHQHTHLSPESHVTGKKFSTRARSDSAPLGYLGGQGGGGQLQSWGGPAGRPRSGSGMLHRGMVVPNIRANGGMGGQSSIGGGGMGAQGGGGGQGR